MENRQIDASQRMMLPSSIKFDASHFTKELQENIISAALNGGDTVHSQILERIAEMRSPQPQPTPIQAQTQLPGEVQARLERLQQFEELAKSPEFAKAYAQVLMNNGAQPTTDPNTFQPAQPTPNEPQPAQTDPFAGLFSNEPAPTTQQNAAPTNQAQPANEQAEYEQFVSTCIQNGVDPQAVAGFIQSLSTEDVVGIYKAFLAQSNPGNQPQQEQTQPSAPPPTPQVPKSIQNVSPSLFSPSSAPAGYPSQRNRLWD